MTLQSTSPSPQTWRSQAINVFTQKKGHGQGGLFLLWEAKAHTGSQMLQAAFWRPSNSSVSTLHLRSDHISNSHLRNFLLVSMMGDTTAFIRRMMLQHHLSCPSWLTQSEPGVIPLCQSPSTLQTRTDTVVFLTTHPAASYFQTQPWPQLALGHHGIRSQLLHSQTNMPWPRCPKTDPREQKGFKEAFRNASHVLMSSAV